MSRGNPATPRPSRKQSGTLPGAARGRTVEAGIFGLGHVGLTTAACLLQKGLAVEGYEVSRSRRALLERGECPIAEPGVAERLQAARKNNTFQVKPGPDAAAWPEIVFVCVGTPGAADGSADLTFVFRVFDRLARLAQRHPDFRPEIILQSTVPPGTLAEIGTRHPDLLARLPVAFHPEFLREGSAMADFFDPPQNVLGLPVGSPRPEKTVRLLTRLGLGRSLSIVSPLAAESLKYACNAYHALKICFANEMGRVVKACGGEAAEVMELFCRDTKLNISSRYLRPGGPYGGSCLRKDLRALAGLGKRLGVRLDLIESCETSNRRHFEAIVKAIRRRRPRVVALLGLAFKAGTGDLRGSPGVDLLQRLVGEGGCRVRVHDFLMRPEWRRELRKPSAPTGRSLGEFVLCGSLGRALEGANLIVVMHDDPRYREAGASRGAPVLDVARWRGALP